MDKKSIFLLAVTIGISITYLIANGTSVYSRSGNIDATKIDRQAKIPQRPSPVDIEQLKQSESKLKQALDAIPALGPNPSQEEIRSQERRQLVIYRDLNKVYAELGDVENQYDTTMIIARMCSAEAPGGNSGSQKEIDSFADAAALARKLKDEKKLQEALFMCGESYFFARRFREAIAPLSEAVQLSSKWFNLSEYKTKLAQDNSGGNSGPYVVSLQFLSMAEEGCGMWPEATALREKLLSIADTSRDQFDQERLGALFDLAQDYARCHEFSKAEKTYLRRVDETVGLCDELKHWPKERLYQPDPCEHMWALDRLTNFYRDTDRDSDAERTERLSLAERERLFGKDSRYVASGLEGLSEILRHEGRSSEAKPLEARAKLIRERTHTAPEHRVEAKLLK